MATASDTGLLRPVPPTPSKQLQMLWSLIARVPLIILTIFKHILHLTESSQYVGLNTAINVSVIRSFMKHTPPQTLSEAQNDSLLDLGIPPRTWISTYSWSGPPERAVRDALVNGIRSLRTSEEQREFTLPKVDHFEADWIAYRGGADAKEAMPEISEKERFQAMMKECTAETTILYLHGGSFYLGDPATIRPIAKKLSKITGGRCFAVRYRLAPQHPFPAALLDALVAYMCLLYPPPEAYHDAVKSQNLVVAGDSAGGNLALSLVRLLLEFRRHGTQILWHGKHRDIPLPAGVTCSAPWLDITNSSPTFDVDHPFDVLPNITEMNMDSKPCVIWPPKHPRMSPYADDHLLTHPLVSPLLVDSWEGIPPVFLFVGWEKLAYENKFLAKKLAATKDVKVVFQEYEALPHSFNLLIPHPNTRHSFDEWGGFINSVVRNPGAVDSSACKIKAKNGAKEPLRFEDLSEETDESVLEAVKAYAKSHLRYAKSSGAERP